MVNLVFQFLRGLIIASAIASIASAIRVSTCEFLNFAIAAIACYFLQRLNLTSNIPGGFSCAQLKDMARQGFFTFDEFNQMCDKLGEKVRSSSPKATQSQRPAPQGKVHTSSRRHPGKVLAIAFKVMRGLVAALNIVPYQAMVTTIVPMTGAAEVYDMISGVSILGDVFNFAIAAIVWYACISKRRT